MCVCIYVVAAFNHLLSERYNRTQKSKLFRYFTSIGKHRWFDILDDLTTGYNETVHRSIKMKPSQVNASNEATVRKTLYPKLAASTEKPSFSLNDSVRISRKGHVFTKGYRETFSHEIFFISGIKKTRPITYSLTAFDGEVIMGSFYKAELTIVDKTDAIYPVESIIKRRRNANGLTELYISWKGYSSAANSWIQESELYPV